MRVTGKVLDEAPPAARVALAAVLGRGSGSRAVPRWLATRVQRHIAEFDHLYALARRESNLYSLSLMHGMRDRWQTLMKSLQEEGIDYEAIEHLDRYMAVRQNFLTATWLDIGPTSSPGLRKALLPALEATASLARCAPITSSCPAVAHPPNLKPRMARATAPATAPQSAGFVSTGITMMSTLGHAEEAPSAAGGPVYARLR
jgi:hypothetical protein